MYYVCNHPQKLLNKSVGLTVSPQAAVSALTCFEPLRVAIEIVEENEPMKADLVP